MEDTPIHNAPNYGCPGYKHVSTCFDNPVEMTMNFMDNTNDACRYMFTQGQKIRMQATLAKKGPRAGLVYGSSDCVPAFTESTEDASFDQSLQSQSELAVIVFPNPASGEVYLRISSGSDVASNIAVFNAFGSLIYSTKQDLLKGDQQITLDGTNWSEGSYYVKVQTAEAIASRLFFIKNH